MLVAFASTLESLTNGTTRLILLGTGGGPVINANRSASSQVIIINNTLYVIDSGDGVARQMKLANLKLASIRHIFITHHHSDHNADYGNLLLFMWTTGLNHQVNTYGPRPLRKMTKMFLKLSECDIKVRIKGEGRLPLKDMIKAHDIQRYNGRSRGGISRHIMEDENVRVTAALVNHPPFKTAFAYRFDSRLDNRSIVISGDTAPSDNLISLAQNADILVHEVMHLPSIEKLIAIRSGVSRIKQQLLASHTTCQQVGRIATLANVKTLVLSHLIPAEYPFLTDEQWLEAVRPYFAGKIIVGHDLLEI
ncbi:unnamed protein product [Didymodactylos carnosus]|uniref:Uncharacterized protein n=1 Tax=Didymodactylos carnosus TaxID=1234261 RepID=A0A8S2F202_9BILA|nr:unnamed protein product [Didymodactylos carnosus]CAF4128477.1 unnamed protein product [Didymodactylos carnosus]